MEDEADTLQGGAKILQQHKKQFFPLTNPLFPSDDPPLHANHGIQNTNKIHVVYVRPSVRPSVHLCVTHLFPDAWTNHHESFRSFSWDHWPGFGRL